jgi:hypothetical protein
LAGARKQVEHLFIRGSVGAEGRERMNDTLETDYLVIGSGATAMAFVDTLLDESDARVVMVDRHHRPGGHWNDAYDFVRLHQPSSYYGVNSRRLGSGVKDQVGLNQGLFELASGAEVVDYFDQVMSQRFLPSGRVSYFPMCNCETAPSGERRFTSRLSGESRIVRSRKLVDATQNRTAVPSTHRPQYAVAPGVSCVPVNELPKVSTAYSTYVVVGSGKTGIDACLWLLGNGVAPASIRWIRPRDAWFLDRANVQYGHEFVARYVSSVAKQLDSIATAKSVPDLFRRLEQEGQLLRIEPSVEPTSFRCATISRAELQELRRIDQVVRLGRVKAIESTQVVLERGSVPSDPDWLYVDCSANGIPPVPPVPVFAGDTVNLLPIRLCQPAFSAALVGWVESHITDDAEKNALCQVVPFPDVPTDWIRMWAVSLNNLHHWSRHEGISQWRARSRLDNHAAVAAVTEDDIEEFAAVQRYRASVKPAVAKLPALLAAIESSSTARV